MATQIETEKELTCTLQRPAQRAPGSRSCRTMAHQQAMPASVLQVVKSGLAGVVTCDLGIPPEQDLGR